MASAGNIAQGAAGGAATGSTILPGWGTAIGAVIGGLGSALGGDDGGLTEQQLLANQQLYGNLLTPEFAQYNPEMEYAVGDAYNPKLAQATTIQGDPAVKQQQMAALAQLAGLSQTGLSDKDAAEFQQAQMQSAQQARGARDAVQNQAQARGMGGSGLEFALKEQANQDAAQRALTSQLGIASDAAQQRAQYLTAYGNDLNSLQNQQFSQNQANSNILNDFNKYNTTNQNQAAQQAWQNRQNIANANVQAKNNAVQYNNTQKQNAFNDQLQKVHGQTGANTDLGGYYANQAAGNQAAWSNAGQGAAGAVAQVLKGSGTSSTPSYAGAPTLGNIADGYKLPGLGSGAGFGSV